MSALKEPSAQGDHTTISDGMYAISKEHHASMLDVLKAVFTANDWPTTSTRWYTTPAGREMCVHLGRDGRNLVWVTPTSMKLDPSCAPTAGFTMGRHGAADGTEQWNRSWR